jgi:translin
LSKTNKFQDNLEIIAARIRDYLTIKDKTREEIIRLCREIIRNSAHAIRAAHRQDYIDAQKIVDSAQTLSGKIIELVPEGHSDLLYSGLIHDSQKELAEAVITLALVTGRDIPTPESIGVSYASYLNGMGEAVGELRRYILDKLRQGDLSRCEELLETMDDIYSTLVTMDFPDAITYGLRRTTDNVRGILEKTRGDLSLILRQKSLEDKLKRV